MQKTALRGWAEEAGERDEWGKKRERVLQKSTVPRSTVTDHSSLIQGLQCPILQTGKWTQLHLAKAIHPQ